MNVERIILNKIQSLCIDKGADSWCQIEVPHYSGQQANDYVCSRILGNTRGLMIAKFGTVELDNLCAYVAASKKHKSLSELWWYCRGYQQIYPNDTFMGLYSNAGFFPNQIDLGYKWKDLVLEDMQEIDVLGSYIHQEKRFRKELAHSIRISIDGYLAPYCWGHPWSVALKGKRVLVVHPFVETISKQYERRELLFDNPDVLPEFADLILIKAVQSIAGNGEKTGFPTWFDALNYMKSQMSQVEYDVALIGCGAYGMHLAAHAKRTGKIGIHMAGWTQMLFGIYGNRWLIDQPEYSRFINDYWVRPSEKEKPQNADSIENGCYW